MISRYLELTLILLLQPFHAAGIYCWKSAKCQQEVERYRVEEIQNLILHQLGFTAPPMPKNVSSTIPTEEVFRIMQDAWNSEEENVETILIPAQNFPSSQNENQNSHMLSLVAFFDVPKVIEKEQILEAKVLFQTRLQNEENVDDVRVEIFKKYSDGSLGEQITDETLTLSANQRVTIQIPTEVVSTWYTTTSGIFVSALVNRENVAIHFQQTTQDFENMLLQLKYLKRGGRERRATTEVCNRENNDDGKCCLFDLEVDFEKLNWKWVILPKKINVRVCRGSCSKNNENKSYLELGHVKITQELYHRNDETDLLATNSSQDETPSRDTKHVLCCHPIEYEYLQLIYLTQSGVVSAANLKSMIATKCSCS